MSILLSIKNVPSTKLSGLGNRLEIKSNNLSFNPVADIVSVTGNSVTLQPDTAYKMYATNGAVTINANPPASGYWGLESHIELFVGSTGYVVTGSNVVLANALEPDAVNNCTVRFHDGFAIIAVEDHVAGYIVVNGSTSGDGSLYYGISTSTNDYVAFDASLNGTTIPLAGAVAEGEKHVVGNGYAETTLTGAVNCGTSKTTFSNLTMLNVTNSGGVMTLGDAFIPSGSTVAVSGGSLAVEKVTGNGVIDLCGTNIVLSSGATAYANGCTFTSGSAVTGGAIYLVGVSGAEPSLTLMSATISGNASTSRGGAVSLGNRCHVNITSTTITGNTATQGGGIVVGARSTANLVSTTISGNTGGSIRVMGLEGLDPSNAVVTMTGCVLKNNTPSDAAVNIYSGTLILSGSNSMTDAVIGIKANVTIASGAIVDLTGNANTAAIFPGGSIIVNGGCTVINSAGSSVSIAGGTYTKIKNDGTTA